MSPENFVYWLQGWLEIQDPKQITAKQRREIVNHLNLVFKRPMITGPLLRPFGEIDENDPINELFKYC